MAIFQKSIINSELNALNDEKVKAAYEKFKETFNNAEQVKNIIQLKEENYQYGFLEDLFVNALGYTLEPKPDYNLVREKKNSNDSKKADGAILDNGKVIGVIELKSTKTSDLKKIEQQAFGYKTSHAGCHYVVTSNFQTLRFYIEDRQTHEEFRLFEATEQGISPMPEEEFRRLYLMLSKESILSGLPLRMKQETKFEEDEITDSLYKLYKKFKEKIFENLVQNNPQHEKLLLFKKSQKLLDRFLFVLFAEDCELIKYNSVGRTVERWKTLQEQDFYVPLYSLFQKLFAYLDKGHTDKLYGEIPAYNGGLFRPDELLDSPDTTIDDAVIEADILALSKFDFNTKVDVNILGHIFEHSLNEMDEVAAELSGQKLDRQKTKRKKDGVFYTPAYITKYIVENTVGKLCDEKKAELRIDNLLIDDSYRTKAGKLNKKGKELFDTFNTYKEWLGTLKILDPACGSGAFLNQTLNFLMAEHQQTDDHIAELEGKTNTLRLHDTDKAILENNIYGVDINEESVEIAKLALWLRTAQRRRPLSDLSGNIKCGNSLIDDPAVAGDKAFKWEEEFPEVFAKGGFDVVLGNPPYVQSHSISDIEKDFIYKNYKTAEYQINTYGIFIEKTIQLLKAKSYYSLIIPNYWLSTQYDRSLRKTVFIENYAFEVINTYEIFEDATVDTLILSGQKANRENKTTSFFAISKTYKTIEERLNAINLRIWEYSEDKVIGENDDSLVVSFTKELNLKGKFLLKDFLTFKKGMQPYEKGKGTPPQTREMMQRKVYHSNAKIDDSYFPLLGAKHIKRNYLVPFDEFIKYGKNLAAPRKAEIFEGERILINRILSKNKIDGVLLTEKFINNTDVFNLLPITSNNVPVKVLYAIIISKLCATYFKNKNVNLNRNAFPKINVNTLEAFPIPEISDEIQVIISNHIETQLSLNKQLQTEKNNFLNTLQEEKQLSKQTKKLLSFYELDYEGFKQELKKQKVSFALGEENNEWRNYFNTTKEKIQSLQSQITQTDQEIDQMVYTLYALTPEEIAIVEGGE